jgi:predicted Zn-dependent protease
LSELYDRTGKAEESIDALRKWLASAAPVDSLFYQRLMGGASLAPETASMKLGAALLKAGRTREAIETLSELIADDPGNTSALDLLREALENSTPESGAIALESLKQAVYANPVNVSLVELLAQLQARSGKLEEAIRLLHDTSQRFLPNERPSASVLQVTIGDLLARADKTQEAIGAYEAALNVQRLPVRRQRTDIASSRERKSYRSSRSDKIRAVARPERLRLHSSRSDTSHRNWQS